MYMFAIILHLLYIVIYMVVWAPVYIFFFKTHAFHNFGFSFLSYSFSKPIHHWFTVVPVGPSPCSPIPTLFLHFSHPNPRFNRVSSPFYSFLFIFFVFSVPWCSVTLPILFGVVRSLVLLDSPYLLA